MFVISRIVKLSPTFLQFSFAPILIPSRLGTNFLSLSWDSSSFFIFLDICNSCWVSNIYLCCKFADKLVLNKLYSWLTPPFPSFFAFSLFSFCLVASVFTLVILSYCMLMLLGVDQSFEVYLPLHRWLMWH